MYKRKNHEKYSLIIHLVFIVKYRYPLLIRLGKEVGRLIFEACEYKPKNSVSSVVKNLKQYTTYYLRQEYDDFISQFIYESRKFWSKGYFVCSIGKDTLKSKIKAHSYHHLKEVIFLDSLYKKKNAKMRSFL